MKVAIEAAGLGRRYGRHTWALRDCSLAIPAGRVVALVGPNGITVRCPCWSRCRLKCSTSIRADTAGVAWAGLIAPITATTVTAIATTAGCDRQTRLGGVLPVFAQRSSSRGTQNGPNGPEARRIDQRTPWWSSYGQLMSK